MILLDKVKMARAATTRINQAVKSRSHAGDLIKDIALMGKTADFFTGVPFVVAPIMELILVTKNMVKKVRSKIQPVKIQQKRQFQLKLEVFDVASVIEHVQHNP